MSEFLKQIEALLAQPQPLEPVLRETLKHFSADTGTIHRLDAKTQLLQLVAQVGLPPQLLDVVKTIPVGKGIAQNFPDLFDFGRKLLRHQFRRRSVFLNVTNNEFSHAGDCALIEGRLQRSGHFIPFSRVACDARFDSRRKRRG